MTIAKFEKVLPLLKIGKADREYFLRWLKRYAGCKTRRTGNDYHHRVDLPVTSEEVIEFSRELLDSKTPAWQRLQAVRAVEAYRDSVLGSEDPTLTNITVILERLAAKEDALGKDIAVTPADQEKMVGIIDQSEPLVIQQARREMRLHYKKRDTERAYIKCIRQFIVFCKTDQLRDLGESDIRAFLTHRAVEGNVAPSTQNQAKSALLFLYEHVFNRTLEFLDFVPADKSVKLPVTIRLNRIDWRRPCFFDQPIEMKQIDK